MGHGFFFFIKNGKREQSISTCLEDSEMDSEDLFVVGGVGCGDIHSLTLYETSMMFLIIGDCADGQKRILKVRREVGEGPIDILEMEGRFSSAEVWLSKKKIKWDSIA